MKKIQLDSNLMTQEDSFQQIYASPCLLYLLEMLRHYLPQTTSEFLRLHVFKTVLHSNKFQANLILSDMQPNAQV